MEVVCLEHGWEVVDLDYVAEVVSIESYVLINRVVIVNKLYGDGVCFFEMCLNLKNKEITALIKEMPM